MLRPSEPAPATTDIALVYRTIAHTVNLLVNDRHSWIIRGERPTDDGILENITWAGDTSWFESLESLVGRWFEQELRVLAAQGATHVWALWKDLQPVALFDMYGDVHTLAGRRNLRRKYLKHDRHSVPLSTSKTRDSFGVRVRSFLQRGCFVATDGDTETPARVRGGAVGDQIVERNPQARREVRLRVEGHSGGGTTVGAVVRP